MKSTQMNMSGGLSETEQKELTVRPASLSWLIVVTTVTPVAKCPITCRKYFSSIATILSLFRSGLAARKTLHIPLLDY